MTTKEWDNLRLKVGVAGHSELALETFLTWEGTLPMNEPATICKNCNDTWQFVYVKKIYVTCNNCNKLIGKTDTLITFGKNKGKKFSECEESFQQWWLSTPDYTPKKE